jgi:hypothetical protein
MTEGTLLPVHDGDAARRASSLFAITEVTPNGAGAGQPESGAACSINLESGAACSISLEVGPSGSIGASCAMDVTLEAAGTPSRP